MKNVLFTTLTALFLVLTPYLAHSSIIYTDLEPDLEIDPGINASSSRSIDLDNDGMSDYGIKVNYFSEEVKSIRIMGYSRYNQVLGSGSINDIEDFWPLCMDRGDEIWTTNTKIWHNEWDSQWDHHVSMTIKGYGINGDGHWMSSENDNFIGIRFKLNNNYHYGWIALEISEETNSCIIKGFAYESEPNKAINAGETGDLSVFDVNNEIELSIYPNPSSNHISIKNLPNSFESYEILITDISGKIYYRKESLILNEKIDISSLTNGVYLLAILTDQKSYLNTFIKE